MLPGRNAPVPITYCPIVTYGYDAPTQRVAVRQRGRGGSPNYTNYTNSEKNRGFDTEVTGLKTTHCCLCKPAESPHVKRVGNGGDNRFGHRTPFPGLPI